MKNILLISAILLLTACDKTFIGPEIPDTAEKNFDYLWREYDRMYGAFVVKDINWDSLYQVYRPMVRNGMPDAELFAVMSSLLDHLDDNHVFLRAMKGSGIKDYESGILGRTKFEDYDAAVADAYVSEKQIPHTDLEYGFLIEDIGYIKIKAFGSNINTYPKAIDRALNDLKTTRGIVVDVRDNMGGEDRVAQYIANRFATTRSLSFTSSLRNGPAHTDFDAPIPFYTEPAGDFQYTKPVIVLTRRHTFSSGETFVLAMKQNANVRTAGDTTGGAFSDAVKRELPNGWYFRVPIADVRAADGKNYESIGLAPDILIQNQKADLKAGLDQVLETAIEVLKE